jgi:hypothetical protein
MRNPNKKNTPPILSYHGTTKGLLKAVWLPIIALVPIQEWYLVLLMSVAGFPLLLTWLAYRWFGYMVSHTQYQGAQLHFDSENSRLFPLLLFTILLTIVMPIVIALILYSVDSLQEGYATLYALTITVIYALGISQILHFVLDDLAKHISKGNTLATMRCHANKGRLFALVLTCLLLRLAIVGSGSRVDDIWTISLLPPFITDILVAVGMMSVWTVPWRACLASLVGTPMFMGVILCYAVRQLHVQGKPLRLQHWLIYQVAYWLMTMGVMVGLVLMIQWLDSSWLEEISFRLSFVLFVIPLQLISYAAVHTWYRLLVRQLKVSTKSDALSRKKGVDRQK